MGPAANASGFRPSPHAVYERHGPDSQCFSEVSPLPRYEHYTKNQEPGNQKRNTNGRVLITGGQDVPNLLGFSTSSQDLQILHLTGQRGVSPFLAEHTHFTCAHYTRQTAIRPRTREGRDATDTSHFCVPAATPCKEHGSAGASHFLALR
jgi:hypothetical protein